MVFFLTLLMRWPYSAFFCLRFSWKSMVAHVSPWEISSIYIFIHSCQKFLNFCLIQTNTIKHFTWLYNDGVNELLYILKSFLTIESSSKNHTKQTHTKIFNNKINGNILHLSFSHSLRTGFFVGQLQREHVVSFSLNCGTENKVWESEQRISPNNPHTHGNLQSSKCAENLIHTHCPYAPGTVCMLCESTVSIAPLFKRWMSSNTPQRKRRVFMFSFHDPSWSES